RLALGDAALGAPLRRLGSCLSHVSSSLLRRLLLAGHGAARPLAGARVRLGGLTAHGQAAAVAQAAVAADVHEPLDVELDLAAEVALDLVLAVDDLAQAADLGLGEVLDPGVGRDLGLAEDVAGARGPDAVDVRECRLDALLAREVDASDPSHDSSLPLLVLGVHAADHVDPAMPTDDLAPVAHGLHRRPNLHGRTSVAREHLAHASLSTKAPTFIPSPTCGRRCDPSRGRTC